MYIFVEAVIVIMCKYFTKLLKTHFFVLQIFCSHLGSFFCAISILKEQTKKII